MHIPGVKETMKNVGMKTANREMFITTIPKKNIYTLQEGFEINPVLYSVFRG